MTRLIPIILLAVCAAPGWGQTSFPETIAPIRLTPAIPGGQPFPDPVTLPQTPEPGALLLVAEAMLLLGCRRGR